MTIFQPSLLMFNPLSRQFEVLQKMLMFTSCTEFWRLTTILGNQHFNYLWSHQQNYLIREFFCLEKTLAWYIPLSLIIFSNFYSIWVSNYSKDNGKILSELYPRTQQLSCEWWISFNSNAFFDWVLNNWGKSSKNFTKLQFIPGINPIKRI